MINSFNANRYSVYTDIIVSSGTKRASYYVVYLNNGSPVYCCFRHFLLMYCFQGFDRVEYSNLFQMLWAYRLYRNFLLFYGCCAYVYLNHTTYDLTCMASDLLFLSCNGAKQGGIISPVISCLPILLSVVVIS